MKLVFIISVFVLVASKNTRHEGPVHPSQDLIDAAAKHLNTESGRIVGGSNANIADFPWQVSLRRSGSHICGASIINSRWVVSAAHCTQASGYSIRAGSTNRNTGGQVIDVIRVINHERYNDNSATYANDISVLELATDLEFNDLVQPIALATQQFAAGTMCTLTGWGRTSGTSSLPTNLLQVTMPVISNQECSAEWFSGGGSIANSHICVFSNKVESACNGDSGGPMTCYEGNTPYLAGATSWGASGCPGDRPSVYTRISSFTNWINSKIN